MSDFAIRTESLGKRYRIGDVNRFPTLKAHITRGARAIWSPEPRPDGRGRGPSYLWAVREVSFQVHPGEVVGIVGSNGAGKTTLLRLLTRTTHPSEGRLQIRGRIGSLLQLGAGFHPELTGRENVYINGSVMGMKRREIRTRFEEIVSFAEVEHFIDMPVKRYSSGMQARLAFAVAAHLDPDVLILDEALATGDLRFRDKCFARMRQAYTEGRTVVVVSHQMDEIHALATRCLLMERGHIVLDGRPDEVVQQYRQRSDAPDQSSSPLDQVPEDSGPSSLDRTSPSTLTVPR